MQSITVLLYFQKQEIAAEMCNFFLYFDKTGTTILIKCTD